MKVFVSGASGAIGKQLVPRLVAAGHEVTGSTTTASKADSLRALGAEPVVVDLLDQEAVGVAVGEAEPDAIIHEATALAGGIDPRHFDRDFAMTNRLRTEGTDHLLAAGRAAGVERFLAQSFAGWTSARTGTEVTSETDPLDPDPPAKMRSLLAAIRHLEQAVTAADGIVLRYGGFYGPGTSAQLDPPGEQVEMVIQRKFPIIGDGGGVWSFIHVADAADATVKALQVGRPGIYNVVDDEPARIADWLPALARRLGAKPPRRVPRWIGRLAAGEAAVVMMTEVRGASNAKAKQELGWAPEHPSWLAEAAGGR
jgi:nucleoside-diphosphate-sugar epimerase